MNNIQQTDEAEPMFDDLAVKQIAATVAILVVLAVLGGLAFIYFGLYNVAADKENSAIKEWVLETTMDNSVEARLDQVGDPPDLEDPERIAAGAEHYEAMCVGCHGSPDAEPGEINDGLNPPAPELVEEGPEEDPRELFWVTKHGVEMTGMPAWGPTHDDESLWGVVALMKQFDEMSAEEYRELVERGGRGHHHGDSDGHGDSEGGHHGGSDDSSEEGRQGGRDAHKAPQDTDAVQGHDGADPRDEETDADPHGGSGQDESDAAHDHGEADHDSRADDAAEDDHGSDHSGHSH